MIMQHQRLSIIWELAGGRQKTDPTNGTVFYVNQFTGECTRDEPDILSSSDGDSDSRQASPADAAPVPPAARDEAEDEEEPDEEEASDSDSDLSSINGRPFSDAAGWLETKFHAICRGHEQECSFKTIL